MFGRSPPRCTHLGQIKNVTPSADGCEECLACGQVGCCDNSVSQRRRYSLSFRAVLSPAGEVSALTLMNMA